MANLVEAISDGIWGGTTAIAVLEEDAEADEELPAPSMVLEIQEP